VDADRNRYVRVPLNDASLSDLLATLRTLYPEADQTLLVQFAANIVDKRDADSVPTALSLRPGSYPILGAELTPLIAEVCPDVATLSEDGDNGEYIEIFNPLAQSVDLRGWRLDWGEGEYVIHKVLPPNGYLILTDDIKNDNDPTPEDDAPGMGSFFDVFHTLPVGSQNQIVEKTDMDLPDNAGMVQLFDARGNLTDYLVYRNASYTGVNRGARKLTPFAHLGEVAPAAPYNFTLAQPADDYDQACRLLYLQGMNRPFTSPAELLVIPANLSQPAQSGQSRNWTFPSLADSQGRRPDVLLIDSFTMDRLAAVNSVQSDGKLQPWAAPKSAAPLASLEQIARSEPASFGKINLNSAPAEVLKTLPGMDEKLAQRLLKARDAARVSPNSELRTSNSELVSSPPRYSSLAAFAADESLWQSVPGLQRLRTLFALAPRVTTASSAYSLVAVNVAESEKAGKRPSRIACESRLRLTGTGASVLDWSFQYAVAQQETQGSSVRTQGASPDRASKTEATQDKPAAHAPASAAVADEANPLKGR
jgi:hypothetical protein